MSMECPEVIGRLLILFYIFNDILYTGKDSQYQIV